MKASDSLERRSASEYGLLDRELCDTGLRARVIESINPLSKHNNALSDLERSEIATYITQLEDALLRHHWGAMQPFQIHEILKCATGLDMEMLSQALAEMIAVDA